MEHNNIALLESRIDYLETELTYLNELLIRCGFPEGIATLKMTAEELLKETDPLYQKHPASFE